MLLMSMLVKIFKVLLIMKKNEDVPLVKMKKNEDVPLVQGFKVLLSFWPLGARKRSYIRTRHSL